MSFNRADIIEINYETPLWPCKVLGGNNLFSYAGYDLPCKKPSLALIGDETVLSIYAQKFIKEASPYFSRIEPFSFQPGDANKTIKTYEKLIESVSVAGFGRDCSIAGLGGGVTLDIAGFVAATYMRGVNFISLPTTLLAAVDAAHGGKNGVNTLAGKNMAGLFYPPRLTLVDIAAFETLPKEELLNGMAEVIKHAAISDYDYFEKLKRLSCEEISCDLSLIMRSVGLKLKAVAADFYEKGLRKILNFGHTAGHAIEAATFGRVSHGRAVAQGMIIEARLAVEKTGFPEEHLRELTAALERLGFSIAPEIGFEEALPYLFRDKKNRRGGIFVALPKALGKMESFGGEYAVKVAEEEFRNAWETR